ncbi:MAG TPA: hypothetical protein VK973_09325 [Arenicellales bacterium]|nr:hypothetical protein [Arenicellales bacterium]
MKLYLAVPRQTRRGAPGAATRPAQTREWIARLPLLNTRESLQKIHDALWEINRAELRIMPRLKLLDMYRSPLRVIQRQVETRLTRGAAPLPASDLATVETYRDCCVEMAYGYKIVILEVARAMKRRHLDELRLSMARAIFYLETTVYACVLYRQSPPEGVWTEIHTIYQYARRLGIADTPIRDRIARTRTSTSISLAYRRALLFGLSDPYHQSVPLMGRLINFLRRHAAEAELREYTNPRTERCQFVIDPQSDYPARAYIKQGESQPPGDALLLDTVNLTRGAHEQLKRLTSAQHLDVELDDEFKDDLGRKLLEEVVHAWGVIPRREEERVEVDSNGVEAMIGIQAVNYCMNGEREFILSSPDRADHASTSGTFQMHQLRRQPARLDKLHCSVRDRAASGLRLAVDYDSPAVGSLRVGDVMAVRDGSGPWVPGIIRWIRCVDDEIQLGLKKLTQPGKPVAVKPVSTELEEPFKEALAFTPEGEQGAPVIQLVAPPGLYRGQRNLFVDDGATLSMVRGRSLVERSQTIEWFECETINL